MPKSADAFRTISEVADELAVPKHVLRFWEVKFSHIRPMKRGGGRRFYRPEELALLRGIRHLLHREGYTIKGVQKILREQGVEAVKQHGREEPQASTASGPSAAAATPAAGPVRAARAGTAVGGAGAASGAAGPQGARARRVRLTPAATNVIQAAIAELHACRLLLQGSTNAGPTSRPKRTPGRSRA